MGNSCHFPSMPHSGKIKFQDAEPPRTLKKESTRVGSSQAGTEERLNDPSQKKPRPRAAGVVRRERKTGLPPLAAWSPPIPQSPPKQRRRGVGTLALRLDLRWILGEAEVGSLYPHEGQRELHGPEAEGTCPAVSSTDTRGRQPPLWGGQMRRNSSC